MEFFSRNNVILLFLVFGFGAVIVTEAAEKNQQTDPLQIYDCKKIMGRIAKRMLKTFSNCTKEVKANNTKEEFEKKMGCIIKCTMQKLRVITPEGKATKESLQTFMDEMVPNDAHDMAHQLIEDCLMEHGPKLDDKQPYCENYGQFAQCMQNTMGDFAEKVNCNVGAFGR